MRLSIVAQVAGRIIRLFGASFLAPAVVAAGYGEWSDVGGFLAGGAASAATGQLLVGVSGGAGDDLRRIEALAVVAGAWLLLAPLCAVPYVWAGLGVVDALLEAMSGITTTGATILTDFEAPGRG
ncbi:MAG: TrkH family potassium uptake protein, partial [Acidobacteria bacterium]|nr:TrkH family potassium uptake protein [Acidobacteriota bacterium]